MIISPEVLTILILNGLIVIFASISLIFAIKIALYWNINATSQFQYKLEKSSYLVSTVIKYIFFLKIPLFLFFIWTLDKTSNLITGAMCAVGVINSVDIGIYLMVLKILNIYLFGIWLTIHSIDLKYEDLKYTKLKFQIYIFLYILLILETILIAKMFIEIDIDKIVSCCGTIFTSNSSKTLGLLLNIDSKIIISIFIINYIALLYFYIKRIKYIFGILNILFLITSIVSLISFFSTYIYELPTHHCPFCLLQKDYYYIGYILYTLLFLGTLYGTLTLIKEFLKERADRDYKNSIIFNTLYFIIVISYPILYLIKNGTTL
jgi:hypothetical protein